MGLLDRLFRRSPKPPRPAVPVAPRSSSPQPLVDRTVTIKRPGGLIETKVWDEAYRTRRDAEAEPRLSALAEDDSPKRERVKKVTLDLDAVRVLDLRSVPSSRKRIVGSFGWVTDAGRETHGGTEYLLVREPRNKFDANAIAVYGKGRKVGYISAAKGAAFTPILDPLPFDAFLVSGAGVEFNSIRLWVDLPGLPALRAFVKGGGAKKPGERTA